MTNKLQQLRTGGGVTEIKPLTDYEEALSKVLLLAIEGLPSRGDSDATLKYDMLGNYVLCLTVF